MSGKKFLWLRQYVNKSLVEHKKFGPAQNVLGPVKGQGISSSKNDKIFNANSRQKSGIWSSSLTAAGLATHVFEFLAKSKFPF